MSIYLLVSGVFLVSCKKEELTPPMIEITLPVAGTNIQVPDSFQVAGTVRDADGLETIQLQLFKPSGSAVGVPIVIGGEGRQELGFTEWFEIKDPNLPSGEYAFKVLATDKKGSTAVAYRSFYVNEWPLERLGLLFVYEHSSTEMRSAYVDMSGNLQTLSKRTMDFSRAAINDRHGQLIIAGSVTGPTLGIDIGTDLLDFTIPSSNTQSTPYFTSVFAHDDRSWLSFYDGRVREIRSDGSTRAEFTVLLDHHAEEILLQGQELFLELRNHSPGDHRLRMVSAQTAIEIQDHLFQGDIVKLMPRNNESIYVLLNEQGQADLYIYDIQNNEKSTIRNLATGEAHDAAVIDGDKLLIAQDDGIYLFDYSTTNYVKLVGLDTPRFVTFDPLLQQFAVATDDFIRIYSYPASGQLYHLSINDPVRELEFWYSR